MHQLGLQEPTVGISSPLSYLRLVVGSIYTLEISRHNKLGLLPPCAPSRPFASTPLATEHGSGLSAVESGVQATRRCLCQTHPPQGTGGAGRRAFGQRDQCAYSQGI